MVALGSGQFARPTPHRPRRVRGELDICLHVPWAPQLQPRIQLLFLSLARRRRRRLVQLKVLICGWICRHQQGFFYYYGTTFSWLMSDAIHPCWLSAGRLFFRGIGTTNPPNCLPTTHLAADDKPATSAPPLWYPPGRAGGSNVKGAWLVGRALWQAMCRPCRS